ncbi:class E sortase [Haloechinothrix salitolerans]|uniref:Class E sortase n=1 Tax=Haloechinothrix salitolerans TaxID=926830 RepID=A0ABW2BRN0_9PSEU
MGSRQRQRTSALVVVVRTFGELMITLGIVVLLFVVYTLYVTDVIAAKKQDSINDELEQSWTGPVAEQPSQPKKQAKRPAKPQQGSGFARIYIPSFGTDFQFVIVEGVGSDELEVGPGHYPDTALPGQPGNVGIAGHRIGKGAPFNDLDKLNSCDAIVLETETDFFVYRVMPMPEEVADWNTVKRRDPRCARVPSLRQPNQPEGGPYSRTVGRRIVTPDRGDAVAPVPYRPDNPLPKAQQASLVTLTTCHPEYGNSERMIVHGALVNQVPKQQAGSYQTLLGMIGEPV